MLCDRSQEAFLFSQAVVLPSAVVYLCLFAVVVDTLWLLSTCCPSAVVYLQHFGYFPPLSFVCLSTMPFGCRQPMSSSCCPLAAPRLSSTCCHLTALLRFVSRCSSLSLSLLYCRPNVLMILPSLDTDTVKKWESVSSDGNVLWLSLCRRSNDFSPLDTDTMKNGS
jgi:hypothetical protein